MSTKLRKCLSLVLVTMLLASISISGSFSASADTQTGDGLAAYAMNAYNEGWQYVWGGASYGYVDCSGLIYSYGVGGGRTDSQMLAASPESGYVSDGVPDIPGLGLWQPGHVGVYIGDGMAVDARDEVSNVCYSSVASKDWVMWFKVSGVTYDGTGVTNVSPSTDTASDNSDTDTHTDTDDSTVLKIGDSGAEVRVLQERLKTLGYFVDGTTEYFGNYTESCLMEFQTEAGLTATGVYDKETQSKLLSDNAPKKTVVAETDSEDVQTDTTYFYSEQDYSDGSDVFETDSEIIYTENSTDIFIDTDSTTDTEVSNSSDTSVDSYFAEFEEYEHSDSESDTDYAVVYKIGDEDEKVAVIQQKLSDLGYYYGETDGIYNEFTASAVEQFQTAMNLNVTGEADEKTCIILFGERTNSGSDADLYENTETDVIYFLNEGTVSNEVTDMQDRLIELRYLTGTASGKYDAATVEAVKLFQEVNGYPANNYITDGQFKLLMTGNAQKSPEYSNLKLGYEGEDVVNLQNTLVKCNYLSYSDIPQLGIYDNATENAVISAQQKLSQTPNGVADETFVTMLRATSQSQQEEKTTNAVVTASNATSSALSEAKTSVDVPKTGVENFLSTTFTLVVIGVTLLIGLFFVTVHYWNVSMEKRRKRAKKAMTVSGYRRR